VRGAATSMEEPTLALTKISSSSTFSTFSPIDVRSPKLHRVG
jgi:hypothetical protein